MHEDIKQFVETREVLSKELQEIDSRILEVQANLKHLMSRRTELNKAFDTWASKKSESRATVTPIKKASKKPAKKSAPARKSAFRPDKNVDTLVNYLTNNPGADRESIRSAFNGSDMDAKKLSLLLGKCSKRGLITNTGTRRVPLWAIAKK